MDAPERGTQRPRRRGAPAKTVEARENQLISLAIDLAEKQLAAGTASAQVITHYLKLGSTTERLEKEKLEREIEVLGAKKEQLEAQKKMEDLYANAMTAFSSYRGHSKEDGEPDDFDS